MLTGDKSLKYKPYQTKEDEEYMSPSQKEHFHAILTDWRNSLVAESKRTVNQLRDEHQSLADPNDRASQEEEFSIELRARDRERKLLRKIDKALDRLSHDDYGYCESCGIEIGVRRLEARPTAELCIDCKHLEEIKEKNRAA